MRDGERVGIQSNPLDRMRKGEKIIGGSVSKGSRGVNHNRPRFEEHGGRKYSGRGAQISGHPETPTRTSFTVPLRASVGLRQGVGSPGLPPLSLMEHQ